MNAPDRSATPKAVFKWEDPLLLDAQLTEDELTAIVNETVKALGITDIQQLGKVMGAVMAKVKGRADGTAVQAVAKRVLGAR